MLKVTYIWMKKLKNYAKAKKQETKKGVKIPIDEEQSPYLKLKAKKNRRKESYAKEIKRFQYCYTSHIR